MVPLRVEAKVEIYHSAFENLQKRKECNRTDLMAYANYKYDRLCLMLVPLYDKINLGPRHKSRSWYLLGVAFKKSDEHPRRFYMGVLPRVCREWTPLELYSR